MSSVVNTIEYALVADRYIAVLKNESASVFLL